ncbi:MAG: hypothetical protein P8010_23710 [Desulfosarcinaceae bacterium]
MDPIQGKIIPRKPDASTANYAVEAKLQRVVGATDEDESGVLIAPVSASTRTAADGAYRIEIEMQGAPKGPVEIIVSAPNGIEVHRREVSLAQIKKPINMRVSTIDRFRVAPSEDPSVGKRLRLTGQVIDEHGRRVPAGLPVVIWGVVPIENDTDTTRPLIVADTQTDGKFSADWPSVRLQSAFARVSGGKALSVPLDDGHRLVRSVLLVIDLDDVEADDQAEENEDCDCRDAPARAPEPVDLTANPNAFSQDLGGTCTDLTTPNRTLEEFSYFTVVRTSEPKIRGVTLGVRRPVPRDLLVDLLGVSIASAAFQFSSARAASLPKTQIALDLNAAKTLVRDDQPPTVSQIERAAWLSELNHTRGLIDAGMRRTTGRTLLDADHPVDWDDTPTIHLAIDIAFGHLLRYREIWRADGYSLGDLHSPVKLIWRAYGYSIGDLH